MHSADSPILTAFLSVDNCRPKEVIDLSDVPVTTSLMVLDLTDTDDDDSSEEQMRYRKVRR